MRLYHALISLALLAPLAPAPAAAVEVLVKLVGESELMAQLQQPKAAFMSSPGTFLRNDPASGARPIARSSDYVLVRFFEGNEALDASRAGIRKIQGTPEGMDRSFDLMIAATSTAAYARIDQILPKSDDVEERLLRITVADDAPLVTALVRTNPIVKRRVFVVRHAWKEREVFLTADQDEAEMLKKRDQARGRVNELVRYEPASAKAVVQAHDWILVRCFRGGKAVTIGDAKLDSIMVIHEGKPQANPITLSFADKKRMHFYFNVDDIEPLRDAPYGDSIELAILYPPGGDGAAAEADRYYTRKDATTAHYGLPLVDGRLGIWAPVGLVGTSGEGEGGLILAAVPVNIGVGARFWLKSDAPLKREDHYIGLSAILGWTINNGPAKSADSGEEVTLASAGVGLLVDLDEWLYLAPILARNFAAKENSFVAAVGPGPKLLRFLAAGN